jgi:thymidylate synthase
MQITCSTTIEAWEKTIRHILEFGEDFIDNENRECREILNLVINIQKPERDIDKPIQLLRSYDRWVYPSSDELAAIILNTNPLPGYEYSYGPRIFGKQGCVNQIKDFVIPILSVDKDSRKAGVSLYNKDEDSCIFNNNIPSLIYLHYKIKNEKLRCTAIIRSCDIFMGWPANIFQIFSLQEHIANKLKVSNGQLSIFCCSAHIFKEHFEHINTILKIN